MFNRSYVCLRSRRGRRDFALNSVSCFRRGRRPRRPVRYLQQLGFVWSDIDREYLKRYVDHFLNLGFLELPHSASVEP